MSSVAMERLNVQAHVASKSQRVSPSKDPEVSTKKLHRTEPAYAYNSQQHEHHLLLTPIFYVFTFFPTNLRSPISGSNNTLWGPM